MPTVGKWTTVEVPELHELPKPIFPRSQNLAAGQMFPLHAHRWNQFVYATTGTLVVTAAGSWYVITPEQAIWLPTGALHTTGALNGAEFRNLYVADSPDLKMPDSCTVFTVTPLLRALIIELEEATRRGEDEPYVDKINLLIYEQLRRLPVQHFHLPWPQTPMLRRVCEKLYANPADSRTIEDWGRELSTSVRTLARRFEKEVGISLREWRYRLRLFLALEWLGSERSITDIALGLGYASTSAFTYMFRREMGCTPSEWRQR